MTIHSRTLVDARERIADRYKPCGDKHEAMIADEQWEKAHEHEDEIRDISDEDQRCQECGEIASEDNEYFVEWGTCNSYCYGKLVGVYY